MIVDWTSENFRLSYSSLFVDDEFQSVSNF